MTVVLLMVVDDLEGGGGLLIVEADERPPARPPLRPPPPLAIRLLVGPKSASTSNVVSASAASGVRKLAAMNDAATIDAPNALATPSVDILSSVCVLVTGAGAKAVDGAIDIAAIAIASADTLTIVFEELTVRNLCCTGQKKRPKAIVFNRRLQTVQTSDH